MKNIILIALMTCLLFSCSKKEEIVIETQEFSLDQYPQKWQLVSMQGNIANMPPATGTDMTWQEYYLLHADGTFTKHRQQNGQSTAVSGTFSFEKFDSDPLNYLVLTYEAKSALVGTCSAEPKENMVLVSSESMHNSWMICDGPTLLYKRVKYEGTDKGNN